MLATCLVLNIVPIMLTLCLMLRSAHYACITPGATRVPLMVAL